MTTAASPADQLRSECARLSESCLYTSTSFFIWLKFLRAARVAFITVPLLAGAVATWKILGDSQDPTIRVVLAVAALVSSVLPSVSGALKIDDHLGKAATLAGEFKNLTDRFHQAATISALKSFEDFESEFEQLRERLEHAREDSLTPPEWCFRRARKKIQKGDYTPDQKSNI